MKKKKKLRKQDPVYAKATRAVARDHPRSTRLDPKPKKTKGITDVDRRDFERWKGGTSIAELARERNVKRRFVSRPFHKLAGGKDKFQELRAGGAGGKAFGGKRSSGRTKEVVQLDDSKVKVVTSGKHWKQESIYEPVVVKIKMPDKSTANFPWRKEVLRVFVSPKGNKYVQAKEMEKADLIVVPRGTKWRVRLRKLETSGALKKLKKEGDVVARGLKARAAKKKQKKQKKKHLARLAKK